MRGVIIMGAAAVATVVAVAGCSSSAAPSAAGSSGPPSVAPTSAMPSAAARVSVAALAQSQCGGSDHGLATEHTAWSTLMRTGSGFTDWESATASYLKLAQGAAQVDAGLGDANAQDAVDARALSSALVQLDADLQQGVTTGVAPSSYKVDAEAVQSEAALFASC